jgi:hypothetical protein
MIARCARVALESQRRFARAFISVTLFASAAHAGHAPLVPEPRTILLREDAPEHIVIGTRRGGYFVTRDAGRTWSWMCESGVGYDDEEVYPGALLAGGTLVVSIGFGGVAVSADGCGFMPWLPSEQPFVADVRVQPGAPDAVFALEARSDGDAFVNQLWQTSDGSTWRALGAPFAADTLAASFAVSEEGELFVGASGPSGAELLHSTDAAQSWQRVAIPAEPGVAPRVVGARGAGESARVFVVADYPQAEGLTTTGDRALLSVDGGRSFAPLLEGTGDLSAWSLSNDGARLAVGGDADGIYVLTDAQNAGASSLMQVSTRAVHALAWSADGRLYAAGHEETDGFSVGVSDDDGRSFQPLFSLCQVQGPVSCSAESSVGRQCKSSGETGWDVRKEAADSDACAATQQPDGAAGNPALPGAPTNAPPEASCAFSPGKGGSLRWWLLTVLAGALVASRRRPAD